MGSQDDFEKYLQAVRRPASVDQTQRVLQQVDAVKGQMHANIATMLQNTETAESMTLKSEQLNEQASVFKKRSTDLRKQMKWKNTKMTIIFVVFLLAIITAITVPLVQKTKKDGRRRPSPYQCGHNF